MLVALIGDTHFGARNSNSIVEYWQRRFYEEIFWPYIEQNKIRAIIQTGDWFDNRKWLNIQSIAFQKEVFVKPSQKLGVDVHVIVGNHDIPLRHSLKNNSVRQILEHESNFSVYDRVSKIEIEDREITLFPWICKENEEELLGILRTGGDIAVGHFEIQGALMHPGSFSLEGLQYSDFSKWKNVISGHFHAQSENGNVHYIGTPYQMSWNDASTKHGFWILDTSTGAKTFVENKLRYFNRFVWDNDSVDAFDLTNLKNSYVKVNVVKKNDFEAFEKFIDKVNFGSPFEVKITESFEEYSAENVNDLISLHSTQELIAEYVDDVAANNAENIKKLMLQIYDEALRLEEEEA